MIHTQEEQSIAEEASRIAYIQYLREEAARSRDVARHKRQDDIWFEEWRRNR